MAGFSNRFSLFTLLAGLTLGSSAMCAAQTKTNPSSVTIKFEFRNGGLIAPVKVNGMPLALKLDTGFGIHTIHPDRIESLGLKPAGTMRIIGIAGEEQATTYGGASYDFGGIKYSPRQVAVIPSDARRRNRDGILGAGFFRRFVVEMDPVKATLKLHDPKDFEYSGKGEIVPFSFRRDTPIVEATINFTNRESIRARYEIDSGCDGELCFGHDFVKTNRLNEIASGGTGSRRGVGGSVDTRHGVLPQFQIGTRKLNKLPANFFQEGSPVGEGLAGHIGMGTLRRFKVIFDYTRRRIILEDLERAPK
jgi:predicted aspartyl protease